MEKAVVAAGGWLNAVKLWRRSVSRVGFLPIFRYCEFSMNFLPLQYFFALRAKPRCDGADEAAKH